MYNAMQNLFLFLFFKSRTTGPPTQSVNLLRLAWKLSHKYFVETLQPDSDSMIPTVTDNLYNFTQSVCYGSTPELIGTGTTIVDTGMARTFDKKR